MSNSHETLALEEQYVAHNYAPLPVVLARGQGSWVYDVDDRSYLDFLCAYSANNFGHLNPRLTEAARRQLERLTLTSRAFHSDQLAPFAEALAGLCDKEAVLPMNTGAEAVETAIKLARRWGYDVKGVGPHSAQIIVCDNNFHGRTISIISFSSDPTARDGYGPYTPGFVSIPFGDSQALEEAIGPNTVAFLLEPIQGEAGVLIPDDGWMTDVRRICTEAGILMIADEIQSGLGRTGEVFACDHEDVTPDLYILGKALGGGIVPLSAVVGNWDILGVINPGEHGSTFGGNPFAAAIGTEVVKMMEEGLISRNAANLGDTLAAELAGLVRMEGPIEHVRSRGLWAGLDVARTGPTGKTIAKRLAKQGVLAKETHGQTIRLSPPLTISADDLALGLKAVKEALIDV